VPRHGYRVGLSRPGRWVDVLNTDAADLGGSGIEQPEVIAEGTAWQGRSASAVVTLPPLAVRWLVPG
jgi:1,4-alpha-glucan branching enzyme